MNISTSSDKVASIKKISGDVAYHMLSNSLDVSRKLFQLQIDATDRLLEQNLNSLKLFLSGGAQGEDMRRASDWQNLLANSFRDFIEFNRSFYEVATEAQDRISKQFNYAPPEAEGLTKEDHLDGSQHKPGEANQVKKSKGLNASQIKN